MGLGDFLQLWLLCRCCCEDIPIPSVSRGISWGVSMWLAHLCQCGPVSMSVCGCVCAWCVSECLGLQSLPGHALNTGPNLGLSKGGSCPTRAGPLRRQGAGKELRQHSWSSCLSFPSPAVRAPQAWAAWLSSSLFVLQREGSFLGPPASWVEGVWGGWILEAWGLGSRRTKLLGQGKNWDRRPLYIPKQSR